MNKTKIRIIHMYLCKDKKRPQYWLFNPFYATIDNFIKNNYIHHYYV